MKKNVVVPYDPDWKLRFNIIAAYLEPKLCKYCISIEHIGSTSIPGMTAKPIIDIDLIIDPGFFPKVKLLLHKAGYIHEGNKGLIGREAFDCSRLPVVLPYHHLYVGEANNFHIKKHLSFRNYLLKRPELVEKVSAFKVKLASEANQDRKEYQRRKESSEFIKEIADRAFEYGDFELLY